MKYDKDNQQYGLMLGKSKLVFIKTGAAGSIYGYKNKYLELASKIQNERGYAVVVSANPVGSPLNLQEELEKISTYLIDIKEIILIGISRGRLLVLQQGYLNTRVSRILAINWHKTKKGRLTLVEQKYKWFLVNMILVLIIQILLRDWKY